MFGGDFLEAAKDDIAGGIAAGEGDAEPSEEGAEEGVEDARFGEGEAEGGVGA